MPRLLLFGVFLGALAGWHDTPARGQDKPNTKLEFREVRLPPGHVEHVVFSPDGGKMAAGAGAEIVVWNVADGKVLPAPCNCPKNKSTTAWCSPTTGGC